MKQDCTNIKSKLEEYKMLRSEILYFMNKDTTLFTCLFTSVTAVLFFSVEWGIKEGSLLVFLIIVPIGSKFAYHQKEMAKISEYMKHYLEEDIGFHWETFLNELSIHQQKPKTAKYLKFSECLMMAVGAVFTFVYIAFEKGFEQDNALLIGIEFIILIGLFVWTACISRKIYKINDYKAEYKRVMDKMQEDLK